MTFNKESSLLPIAVISKETGKETVGWIVQPTIYKKHHIPAPFALLLLLPLLLSVLLLVELLLSAALVVVRVLL